MHVRSQCFAALAIQLRCVLIIFLEVEKGIQTMEHSSDISRILGWVMHDRYSYNIFYEYLPIMHDR